MKHAELNIGDTFILRPKARTRWLAFGKYTQGGVVAVRCDSEIGKSLLAWMAAGRDENNLPCPPRDVSVAATTFYEHDLTEAVKL